MENGCGIRIVITGIGKSRAFADSQRKKKIRAYVSLAKMDDGSIRGIARYENLSGNKFIFDPSLGYAYPEKIYRDYSRRSIVRETKLGRTMNPGMAAIRLFLKAKDAVE
jgi:hypothetical protein